MTISSTPSIVTRLTRDYAVRHPIACAGMAFVGTPPGLAIAVCQSGAMGSLAAGLYGPDWPDFNPMRVLKIGLAQEFTGREGEAPHDLEAEPIIGEMDLGGETVPLRRFTSFVPTPTTRGDIEQLPFLAG